MNGNACWIVVLANDFDYRANLTRRESYLYDDVLNPAPKWHIFIQRTPFIDLSPSTDAELMSKLRRSFSWWRFCSTFQWLKAMFDSVFDRKSLGLLKWNRFISRSRQYSHGWHRYFNVNLHHFKRSFMYICTCKQNCKVAEMYSLGVELFLIEKIWT